MSPARDIGRVAGSRDQREPASESETVMSARVDPENFRDRDFHELHAHEAELFSSPDYLPAEKWADEYAGDCETHVAVVEDFGQPRFVVMLASSAAAYISTHDAEIQYEADRTPEWFASNA